MTTLSPTKRPASRMGGIVRRASTVLIVPARKKPKKSRINFTTRSLFGIFKQAPSLPPPNPGALYPPDALYNSHPLTVRAPRMRRESTLIINPALLPTPIAQSPSLREAAAFAPRAVKSLLSQKVKPAATSSADQDPSPGAAAPAPQPQPQPQTSATGPIPAEDVPPPSGDNTAAGPGAFTDDVDDLPLSDPIPGARPAAPDPEPQPQTSATGPIPAEDVPPPADNTAAGPSAFADDVDDPPSDPIPGSQDVTSDILHC